LLRCFGVDHQLKLGWLLDGQIRGPGALLDVIYKVGYTPVMSMYASHFRSRKISVAGHPHECQAQGD